MEIPPWTAVQRRCPFCGKEQKLTVPRDEYTLWEAGAHVQDAFKSLSPGEREFFVTGICPTCWGETFPPEEA